MNQNASDSVKSKHFGIKGRVTHQNCTSPYPTHTFFFFSHINTHICYLFIVSKINFFLLIKENVCIQKVV